MGFKLVLWRRFAEGRESKARNVPKLQIMPLTDEANPRSHRGVLDLCGMNAAYK